MAHAVLAAYTERKKTRRQVMMIACLAVVTDEEGEVGFQ
jgi:hypothetical protein